MTRIYISSTFEDLKEHRERVYKALRSMSYDVIAMEDYVATDKRPLDKCLEDVGSSDLYIGILAWRYGYVPRKDNPKEQSITERELRHAVDSKVPCLLFLHDENAPWPPAMVDSGTELENMKALRAEVVERFTVRFFTDADNLASQVVAAVSNWQRQRDEAAKMTAAPRDSAADEMYTAMLSDIKREISNTMSEMVRSYAAGRMQAPGAAPDAVDPLAAAEQVDEDGQEADDSKVGSYEEVLRRVVKAWGLPAATAFPMPVVSPLVLDVGPALSSKMRGEGNDGLNERFRKRLEDMRAKVFDEYGVRVPGVRIREGLRDDMAYTYNICINEVPLVSGSIREGARLCPVSLATLRRLGIEAEETQNPINGAAASWVRRDRWKAVKKADLPLWDDIEYPIRHIYDVILKNLSEFVRVEEAYRLLQEKDEELVGKVKKSGSFVELRGVLRILLDENVSINRIDEIAAAYLDHKAQGAHVLEILDYVRTLPAICATLPGNNADATLYSLDTALLGMIKGGIEWHERSVLLALIPEDAAGIAAAVRKAVQNNQHAVLVTEEARHRRALKKAVELEFPWLPVLARAELIPELQDQDAIEISVVE